MSDTEKRLRQLLGTISSNMKAEGRERTVSGILKNLDALLSEHRAALEELNRTFAETLAVKTAQVRADTLEEAARWFEDSDPGTEWDAAAASAEMRTLATTTPPASIPVERVWEVVRVVEQHERADCDCGNPEECVSAIRVELTALDIGVPLDGGADPVCPDCRAPRSAHDERGQRWWVDEAGGHLCAGFHPDVVAGRSSP